MNKKLRIRIDGQMEEIMAEAKSAFQLRLDKAAHRKAKAIADREFRSLNAQIEYFVYRGIAEYEKEHGKVRETGSAIPKS